MKQFIKRAISSLPFVKQKFDLIEQMFVPPGHFYSPYPETGALKHAVRVSDTKPPILGVDFRYDQQLELLKSSQPLYDSAPWENHATAGNGYQYENEMFGHSDALFFHFILGHFKPSKIIEVGSGWSTALALDSIKVLDHNCHITCVEPFPERLLKTTGGKGITLIQDVVQNVPLEVLCDLEESDILFIDSSHVSKLGSDVNHLFFEVLPRLAPGVVVHVHDIHKSFEYPVRWAEENRAWTEAYLLRALLMDSSRYEIILANDAVIEHHQDWFQENMPLCLTNPGGSLWFKVMEK